MKLFVDKFELPLDGQRRTVKKFLFTPRCFDRDWRFFETAEIVERYSSEFNLWSEIDFQDNRTKHLENIEKGSDKMLGIDIKSVKKTHIMDDEDRRHKANYEPVGKNIYEIFDVFLNYYKESVRWKSHNINEIKTKLCREIRILGYPVYERDLDVDFNQETKHLEIKGANRYVDFILEVAKKNANQEVKNKEVSNK